MPPEAAFFFFQAEDGIRDGRVTGVQTCALPIYDYKAAIHSLMPMGVVIEGLQHDSMLYSYLLDPTYSSHNLADVEIGRASCRERVRNWAVGECRSNTTSNSTNIKSPQLHGLVHK